MPDQVKPAPTAAEISKARDFLDDRYLDNVLSLEFPCTADHIRTLLAALDAAEARATAAEFNYCAHDLIVRHFCQMNASLFSRLGLPVAELDEMDPPGVEFALTEAILKLQRERDEARAAFKRITERRFPIQRGPSIRWSVLAPHEAQARRNHSQSLERLAERGGLDPVEAMAVYEDREYPIGATREQMTTAHSAWRALVERTDAEAQELAFRAAFLPPGAIVVADGPETRERIAKSMLAAHAERYSLTSEPDGETVKTSRQYAAAVLAALKESAR